MMVLDHKPALPATVVLNATPTTDEFDCDKIPHIFKSTSEPATSVNAYALVKSREEPNALTIAEVGVTENLLRVGCGDVTSTFYSLATSNSHDTQDSCAFTITNDV